MAMRYPLDFGPCVVCLVKDGIERTMMGSKDPVCDHCYMLWYCTGERTIEGLRLIDNQEVLQQGGV